jgi:hypothetical protein
MPTSARVPDSADVPLPLVLESAPVGEPRGVHAADADVDEVRGAHKRR